MSVKARTGQFDKKMRGSRRRVQRFGTSLTAAARKAALFGGAIAAAAAGGGLALLVRQSFKTIDAIAKTSDKLGLATDKLIGLRHAAELSGVASNKLEMGLQRMARRIAEAAQGAGEAKAAILELGLDAAKLAKLPLERQFYAIADAMELVTSQSERIRLGFKLFDSEGVALINTLRGGSAALMATQRDAERLGKTFTRIDAAKIEAANDALLRMRGMLEGASTTLAVQLAPYLEALAEHFVAAGIAGKGMGDKVVRAFEWTLKAVAKLADWLELLKAGFYGLRTVAETALLGVSGSLEKLAEGVALLGDILGIPSQRIADVQATLKAFNMEQVAAIKESAALAKEAWANFTAGANEQAVTSWFEKLRRNAEAAANAVTNVGHLMGPHLEANVGMTTAALKEQTAMLKKLGAEAERMLASAQTPLERLHATLERIALLRFHQFIDDAQMKRLEKVAQKAYAGGKPDATRQQLSRFLEIDVKRVVVEGLRPQRQQEQRVTDPKAQAQRERMTRLLERIESKDGGGDGVARAA